MKWYWSSVQYHFIDFFDLSFEASRHLMSWFPWRAQYLPTHTLISSLTSFQRVAIVIVGRHIAIFILRIYIYILFIILLILIANLSIGYRLAPKIGVPKKLNNFVLHDSKGQSPPIWLNGFLSLIAPSWYLNIFDTNAIKKSKNEELIELSNNCTTIYIRKAFIKKPN